MSNSIVLRPNKLAIYRRSRSGNWQCRFKLANGEWYRQTTGSDDQEEATDIAFKIFYGADAKDKNNLPQNTRKFANVARLAIQRMEDELAVMKEEGKNKPSFKDYIRVINNYLVPYFGRMKIDTINARKLIEYSSWRNHKMAEAKNEKRINGLKNKIKDYHRLKAELAKPAPPFTPAQSTLNTHNSALNKVFAEALLRGWITDSIKPTVLNKGVKSEARGAFSLDEYQKIYKGLRKWSGTGHRNSSKELREVLREYVLILANTGIRHGTEAINIKWSNIRYFTAHDKQEYIEISVKGKVGNRQLIARDSVERYLERMRDLDPDLKDIPLKELLAKKLDLEVFRTRSGKQVTSDALRGSFRQFLEHIDILRGTDGKTRSLYGLRHTYATFELAKGRDIHSLSRQMGTSVAMLENFYSKISPQMNAAIHSGRIDKMIKEQQKD